MTTPPAAPLSLWHNRDFQLLMSGRTLAVIGSAMSGLPFMLIAFDITKSPTAASLIAAMGLIGSLTMSLPAGAVVDRVDRKKLLVWSSLVVAAATATIPISLALGVLSLAQLAVVALISGIVDTFYGPAETASLKRVVDPAHLGTAMSVNQARGALGQVIGPLLGGALYGVNRIVPFVVDASASLLAGLLAGGVRADLRSRREERPEHRSVWGEIVDGLRYLGSRRVLVAIAVIACLANFGLNEVVGAAILALQVDGVNAAVIGLLSTSLGIAALLGALLAAPILQRVRVGWLMVLVMAISAAVAGALTVVTLPWQIMAVLCAVTLVSPALNSGLMAYFVSQVHDHMQGRANSAIGMLAMGLMPVAQMLAGVLLEHVGRATAMLPGVVAMVLAFFLCVGVREVRAIERTADFVSVDVVESQS